MKKLHGDTESFIAALRVITAIIIFSAEHCAEM